MTEFEIIIILLAYLNILLLLCNILLSNKTSMFLLKIKRMYFKEMSVVVGLEKYKGYKKLKHLYLNGLYAGGPVDIIYLNKDLVNADFYERNLVYFHELGHWTGHKFRLNRDLINIRQVLGENASIESQLSYIKEEIIAELVAVYLSRYFNFPARYLRHSPYLKEKCKEYRALGGLDKERGAIIVVQKEDDRVILSKQKCYNSYRDVIISAKKALSYLTEDDKRVAAIRANFVGQPTDFS